MAITREYNVPLSDLGTFRIGGMAKEVVTLDTEADLVELFRTLAHERKWFMLGGGSNVIFPDGDCDTLIIRLAPWPMRLEEIGTAGVRLVISAGTVWDDAVAYAVGDGLSGIEALSAIPGTAGATPIQNVGAYGIETKDVLESVRAFDIQTKQFVTFTNAECRFGYRDSMFKHEGKGRYIITEVTFLLTREPPNVPQYPGVAEYLAAHDIRMADISDIRNAIISIRASKLPDPREIASVGSFFKNPIVDKALAERLKEQYPKLAVFPASETMSKVGAGSLIEGLGWKGKNFGTISIYGGNAMVLVNEGGATRQELADVVATIVAEVQNKYGITLEPEPELLDL